MKEHILRQEDSQLGKSPAERNLQERLQRGIVCIDKPPGPSSHEVAAFVRKILDVGKTGHTGTLDQNVSGVLVVLLNESRKVSRYLARSPKEYVCLMRLGHNVARDEVEAAFAHFRGVIYQTPPEASAVKKRLRTRTIYELEILEADERDVLFRCQCEAGTYVRNLVHDAGEVLGELSEMRELRRTKAGGLGEKQSVPLQKLSDAHWLAKEKKREEELLRIVLPLEEAVRPAMNGVTLSDEGVRKGEHGVPPRVTDVLALQGEWTAGEPLAAFTGKGSLAFILEASLSSQEVLNLHAQTQDAPFAQVARVLHGY